MSDPAHMPRDVKLLHLILASMGVSTFQDHVPLMLMDFAYRYTTGVLKDALVYNDYAGSNGGAAQTAGLTASSAQLSVEDVRLAVASRVLFQFKPTAPKELLLELAQERNKRPLPPVPQTYGLRLPPEKYCLTGQDRDIDEDDDIIIPGYEKMDLANFDPESDLLGDDGDASMDILINGDSKLPNDGLEDKTAKEAGETTGSAEKDGNKDTGKVTGTETNADQEGAEAAEMELDEQTAQPARADPSADEKVEDSAQAEQTEQAEQAEQVEQDADAMDTN